MIMYPKLVQCTAFTNSAVLTHVLLSLARGGFYAYDNISFDTTRDIITIEKQGRTIIYQYVDQTCEQILHELAQVLEIAETAPEPPRTVFRESMIRDYVARQIECGSLDLSAGRRLVSQIITGQITKLVSARDFEVVDGRIVALRFPDTLRAATVAKPSEPSTARPRLDMLWIAQL